MQDLSDDDARAAGFGAYSWVVRRTVVAVHAFPTFTEALAARTWCSGFGAAWAERRISLMGDRGGHVESATLWVNLDARTMRPTRLPAEFLHVYQPSATLDGAVRRVASKPLLADAPPDAWSQGADWPLRFADFDVLEHVNNAVYWAVVEQELAGRQSLRAPLTAVVEHGTAIERQHIVRWFVRERADGFDGWLVGAGGEEFAAVRVSAGV